MEARRNLAGNLYLAYATTVGFCARTLRAWRLAFAMER